MTSPLTIPLQWLRSKIPGRRPGDGVMRALLDGEPFINQRDGVLGWLDADGALRTTPLTGLATLDSPTFTGTPRAPVAAAGDSSTTLATTSFVARAVAALVNGSPAQLDTLKELADALGDDANFAAEVTAALAARLRFDAAQDLTPLQRAQGRRNLGAGRFESEAYFNIFVNPRQRIIQFNNSGPYKNSGGYVVDGWVGAFIGSGMEGTLGVTGRTGSSNIVFASRSDLDFSLYLNVTKAKPALDATDVAALGTRIEGLRMQSLQWGTSLAKPLLVGFLIRATFTGKIAVAFRNFDATRSCVHGVAVTAGVEQFVSFIVPGDTAGVWKTDSGVGLYFDILGAVGSQYVTNQPDTWLGGNFLALTSTDNIMAVAGQGLLVTDFVGLPMSGMDVTAPAVINPDRMQLFQRSDHAELVQCMRYFETGVINLKEYSPTRGITMIRIHFYKVRKRAFATGIITSVGYSYASDAFLDRPTDDFIRGNAQMTLAGGYCESDIYFTADARL